MLLMNNSANTILATAFQLSKNLQHTQISPIHLFAAALTNANSPLTKQAANFNLTEYSVVCYLNETSSIGAVTSDGTNFSDASLNVFAHAQHLAVLKNSYDVDLSALVEALLLSDDEHLAMLLESAGTSAAQLANNLTTWFSSAKSSIYVWQPVPNFDLDPSITGSRNTSVMSSKLTN